MRLRNNEGDFMDFQELLDESGYAEILIDENDHTNHTFNFQLNKEDLQDLINWAQSRLNVINSKAPS